MSFWQSGRQTGGYQKRLLWQGSWFDVYLLRFPQGSQIDPHYDPVPGKQHHRVNLLLAGDAEHWINGRLAKSRVVRFRPDEQLHFIPRVKRTSYFLSIGWVRDGKTNPKTPS